MLTQLEIKEKGLHSDIDITDILKLFDLIKDHSGVKTSTVNDQLVVGNEVSYQRHED